MTFRLRSLVAALTIVALLFSAFWATGFDALSDTLKADTLVLEQHAHDVDYSQPQADTHNKTFPEQSCNHGCHVAVHLLGLFETQTSAVSLPVLKRVASFEGDSVIDNPFLQGPFRPPLALPLA